MVVVAIVAWYATPYLASAYLGGATAASTASAAAVGSAGTAAAITAGAVGGAVIGASSSAIYGGSASDILKGALIGAISGAVTAGIGHGIPWGDVSKAIGGVTGKIAAAGAKAALHGLAQGAVSEASGGDFVSGFIGGAVGSAAGSLMDWSGTGEDNFARAMRSEGAGGVLLRTSMAAAVGGTAAQLSGGSFANGAISAAFVHLFNDEMRARFTSKSIPEYDTNHDDPKGSVSGGILEWRDSKGGVLAVYNINSGGYKMTSSLVVGDETRMMAGAYFVDNYRGGRGGFFKWDGVGYTFDVTSNRYQSDLRIHPDGGFPGTHGCLGIREDATKLIDFKDRLNGYLQNHKNIKLIVE